jgi:ankyrin repeat protein
MYNITPIVNQSQLRNTHWTTPLHIATVAGHIQIIDAMLKHNTPINIRNSFGNTALMQLAATSYVFPWCEEDVLHVARYFYDKGVDINAANYEGFTAEMLARQSGYKKLAKELHEVSNQHRNAHLLLMTHLA